MSSTQVQDTELTKKSTKAFFLRKNHSKCFKEGRHKCFAPCGEITWCSKSSVTRKKKHLRQLILNHSHTYNFCLYVTIGYPFVMKGLEQSQKIKKIMEYTSESESHIHNEKI